MEVVVTPVPVFVVPEESVPNCTFEQEPTINAKPNKQIVLRYILIVSFPLRKNLKSHNIQCIGRKRILEVLFNEVAYIGKFSLRVGLS